MSFRVPVLAALVAFLSLHSSPIVAQSKVEKVTSIEGITEYKLENGVRFLLFPDPAASTVTVNMTVFVGSRHEGYGETGMAHLLEHMLFKGSKNFPKTDEALEKHGAQFNGTTWVDRTNYYEIMPANDENLEFGIKLEADRLVNSFINREDLAKEMTVVRNEFEFNENNPETILSQRMMAVAFEWHNYGQSTIGNRTDIERVPIERLQAFYRKYYQPDNIMVVVAGKFDEKKAKDIITREFGAIKRPARTLDYTYTEEPAQDGERIVTLRRVGKVAVVGAIYHIPAAAHPDFAAAEVLNEVLAATPSGRLYKSLVETKKASRVSGDANGWFDPGVMEFTARVGDTSSTDEVRDIMLSTIEDVAAKPITKEEVERAQTKLKASRDRILTNSKVIAIELSEWAGAGDWRLLFLHRDRVAKVTAEDVNRVAAKYLTRSNRTLGIFIPSDQVARTPIPTTPDVAELLKEYKGGEALSAGEAFDPTPENIEKRLQRVTLPNGFKVALLPKKTRGESVVARMALHFGNDESLKGQTTACDFVGPMLMRGTKSSTRQQIQDRLDKLGASMTASSDTAEITIGLQAKRKSLPEVLALLKEVLREPTFPEAEFDILKRGQKQSLEKALTDPQQLAVNTLMRQLHPYSASDVRYRPTIAESIDLLERTTVADVARLYRDQVGGASGEIAIVGDFDSAEALKEIEGIVAGWNASAPYKRITRTANTTVKGDKKDINTPDKESAVYLAGLCLPVTDTAKDYTALEVGNFLLGGTFTSRLFMRLRQNEGLSYAVGSQLYADSQDEYGLFLIFAICNPENVEKADKAAVEELNRLIAKGVTEDELGKGKENYLQQLKVQRASDASLAEEIRDTLELGRTYEFYANQEKTIAGLSAADVSRALSDRLPANRLNIIRAGDMKAKKK